MEIELDPDNSELVVNGHTLEEIWALMLEENITDYENTFGKSAAYWVRKGDRGLHDGLEGRCNNTRVSPTFDFMKWSKQRVKEAMLVVKSELEKKKSGSL